MDFQQISLKLFQNGYCFAMGAEQYANHAGRDASGRPMSGALLWSQAEAARLAEAMRTGQTNMVSAEQALAKELATRAPCYVAASAAGSGVSMIDFGPGTIMAFREKSLPLARAVVVGNGRCILVDGSEAFLDALDETYGGASGCPPLQLVRGDIFAGDRYARPDEPAFMVMFGRTFGNIDAPPSDEAPYEPTADTLRGLANAAPWGWLAVSVGAQLDRDGAKAYYEAHPGFQLNPFYRMSAELPVSEEFDPAAFHYEADVRGSAEFIQVVHTAVVSRDISFTLAGEPIELRKHDRLHLKNSFCFSSDFMRECAGLAGLKPVDFISDGRGSDMHVFAKARS